MNINHFINNNLPLVIGTLGLAALGYLGYHAVKYLVDHCPMIQKINAAVRNKFFAPAKDPWWTQINNSDELTQFKKNWKNLTNSNEIRIAETNSIEKSYKSYQKTPPPGNYNAPLGKVYEIPGDFSLWMPGVAIVTSYLAEKKKIDGLYVCANLETLSRRVGDIAKNPADQRYAFIVGTTQQVPGYPQHKLTVCIEKKDGKMSIALLDAMPQGRVWHIMPTEETTDDYDMNFKSYSTQEQVFQAIIRGCMTAECMPQFYYPMYSREKFYGCEVFALQDGVAFLQDPNFFERIQCDEGSFVTDGNYSIKPILLLPPEYMVGTQISDIIHGYRLFGGNFDETFPGKSKTLNDYLNKYKIEGLNAQNELKSQNHYMTKKWYQYLHFVLASIKHLPPNELQAVIDRSLVT